MEHLHRSKHALAAPVTISSSIYIVCVILIIPINFPRRNDSRYCFIEFEVRVRDHEVIPFSCTLHFCMLSFSEEKLLDLHFRIVPEEPFGIAVPWELACRWINIGFTTLCSNEVIHRRKICARGAQARREHSIGAGSCDYALRFREGCHLPPSHMKKYIIHSTTRFFFRFISPSFFA